tara:strand:+ start:39 stop:491 length:453 start_codon:yes stop_codon:yes gene_type:complete
MAYSVQKTKWSQNNPTERVKTNEQAGRLRVAYATYEASAEQATIEMFNLPNGARIVAGYLGHDALGSSTTLSVGYAAHTNSAGSTVSASAAAYKAAAASTADQVVAFPATMAKLAMSEVDANQDGLPVTVTLGGANGTGTISCEMFYVVD